MIRHLGSRRLGVNNIQFQVESTYSLAPSWSWISQRGARVVFDITSNEDAKLLSYTTTPKLTQQESLTAIQGCNLVVNGKILPVLSVWERPQIRFFMDYEGMDTGELDENTQWLLLEYDQREARLV